MEKLFTVAGTSNLNGVVKFRFANDLKGRTKVLLANGHTEVQLIQLPTAMTKADAIAYMETLSSEEPAVEDTAEPTRTDDEALLEQLEQGAVVYDEATDTMIDSRMDPAMEPGF